MITLLASIAGFITSIVPEIIRYFKDINDKKHELDILEKQIKFNTLNATRTLQEIQISQEIIEQVSRKPSAANWMRLHALAALFF